MVTMSRKPFYICGVLRMPTTRSSGIEDNSGSCERVLSPTSYIIEKDGLCVDVSNRNYTNGNKIIMWRCGNNKTNQLWTLNLRSDDSTIRSGGKCLTRPYSTGENVMIYDCDTAAPRTTKWEIDSDGTIRNPIFGLVLTASKGNLIVDNNSYGSRQAFYVTNNTNISFTTIVGYEGLCLVASDSYVWLDGCVSDDAEQQWMIYPDLTIRPRTNDKDCLRCDDVKRQAVVGGCDGGKEERWRFQSNGTILHVKTGRVLDVKDTAAKKLELTVTDYNDQRPSQTWFMGQP